MISKYLKHILTASVFCLILVLGGVSIWPSPSAPDTMQTLDLTEVQNEFYINEDDYERTMMTIVEPFIDQFKASGYFTSFDGASLYYEQYLLEQPNAHITISHGFTESSQKYKEVIYYFLKSGYSVSTLDHRGHGLSERNVDDLCKVYITDFNFYLSDLKTFMDTVVIPDTAELSHLLYAHSMGGAIGSLFIEDYPGYFDAAVLSSPMMEIDTGSYPKPVAIFLTKCMLLLGQGERYIFGQGPYEALMTPEENSPTSAARFSYLASKIANTPYLQVSGGSFSWLNASMKATKKLINNADKANIPILLFQAEHDELVLPGGQYQFVNKAPNATLISVPETNHEIYFTNNSIMIPYFNRVLDFFKDYQTKKAA